MWEKLSKEQQNNWENSAAEHQGELKIIKLLSEKGCPYCQFKADRFGKLLFHVFSSHGIEKKKFCSFIQILAVKYGGAP